MAVAIWRLLSDQVLRQQMIDKGLMRARRFSWKKAALETLDIYHRLAK